MREVTPNIGPEAEDFRSVVAEYSERLGDYIRPDVLEARAFLCGAAKALGALEDDLAWLRATDRVETVRDGRCAHREHADSDRFVERDVAERTVSAMRTVSSSTRDRLRAVRTSFPSDTVRVLFDDDGCRATNSSRMLPAALLGAAVVKRPARAREGSPLS